MSEVPEDDPYVTSGLRDDVDALLAKYRAVLSIRVETDTGFYTSRPALVRPRRTE